MLSLTGAPQGSSLLSLLEAFFCAGHADPLQTSLPHLHSQTHTHALSALVSTPSPSQIQIGFLPSRHTEAPPAHLPPYCFFLTNIDVCSPPDTSDLCPPQTRNCGRALPPASRCHRRKWRLLLRRRFMTGVLVTSHSRTENEPTGTWPALRCPPISAHLSPRKAGTLALAAILANRAEAGLPRPARQARPIVATAPRALPRFRGGNRPKTMLRRSW